MQGNSMCTYVAYISDDNFDLKIIPYYITAAHACTINNLIFNVPYCHKCYKIY